MSLNRIVIIGRLTRDPELRATSNGTPVATFTAAVDRNVKNARGEFETDFIPVVAWRGQAESCAKYLSKGKLVAVDGRLQIRTYEAQDGSKRTAAEVHADNVRFLSPTNSNNSSHGESYNSAPDPLEMAPLDVIPF